MEQAIQTLREIRMNNNGITSDGIVALARAVASNRSLEVCGARPRLTALHALAHARGWGCGCACCSIAQILELSDNAIHRRGALALQKGLARCVARRSAGMP
jgi:Ran GTPase-activating protein (RanGAP) involved in mRNA processing and transport